MDTSDKLMNLLSPNWSIWSRTAYSNWQRFFRVSGMFTKVQSNDKLIPKKTTVSTPIFVIPINTTDKIQLFPALPLVDFLSLVLVQCVDSVVTTLSIIESSLIIIM